MQLQNVTDQSLTAEDSCFVGSLTTQYQLQEVLIGYFDERMNMLSVLKRKLEVAFVACLRYYHENHGMFFIFEFYNSQTDFGIGVLTVFDCCIVALRRQIRGFGELSEV